MSASLDPPAQLAIRPYVTLHVQSRAPLQPQLATLAVLLVHWLRDTMTSNGHCAHSHDVGTNGPGHATPQVRYCCHRACII